MIRNAGVGFVLLVLLGVSSLHQTHASDLTINLSMHVETDARKKMLANPANPLGIVGPIGYGELTFEPPNPVAGQNVQLRLMVGECNPLFAELPTDRELIVEGNTVRVTVVGTLPLPFPCGLVLPQEHHFNLGSFSPGIYHVEFYRRASGSDPVIIDLVQTGQFSVAAAASAMPQPVVIPGLTRWGAGLGMLGISIFALLALRRH